MNRLYLITRRTLQCAVFACPLALLSPWLGALCQWLFSLYAAAFLPIAPPVWKKRRNSPAALMRQMLFPCSAALFLGYFPRFLILGFFDTHILTAQLINLLSAFTAIVLQCFLVRFFPHERREHKYLAAVCLFFFIACTLSAG